MKLLIGTPPEQPIPASSGYPPSSRLASGKLLVLALCCLLLGMGRPGAAQETQQYSPVTESDIAQLSDQLASATEFDDQQKSELTSRLEDTSARLKRVADWQAATRQQQTLISGAADTIDGFREELAKAQSEQAAPGTLAPENADRATLESRLALAESDRKHLSDRQVTLLQEEEQVVSRRREIQDRLAAIQSELLNNRTGLNTPADTLEEQIIRTQARARQQALQAEKDSLEAEVLAEPSRAEIRAAERAWLDQALADTDTKLKALTKQIESVQADATQAKLDETAELQAQVSNENPAIQSLVGANRTLAEQLHQASITQDKAHLQKSELQEQLQSIAESFSLMRRRLEVAAGKELLVQVMLGSLEQLPDTGTIKKEIQARNDQIVDISMAYINADEELRKIGSRDSYLAARKIDYNALDSDQQALLDKVLAQRRQLLDSAIATLRTLQSSLIENNEQSHKLITSTKEFRQFLVGNLLWVRNFTVFQPDVLTSQIKTLTSPANWARLPSAVYQGYHNSAWGEVLLGGLVLLTLASWRVRKPFNTLIRKPTRLSDERLSNMVAGIVMTMVWVSPAPALLWFLAYSLNASEASTTFPESVAAMLTIMGRDLYALLFVRKMIHPFGVGRRMLKWHARMQDYLRRELRWAGPLFIVTGGIEAFAWNSNMTSSGGPLAAICVLLLTLMLITFATKLLRQPLFGDVVSLRQSLRLLVAVAFAVLILQMLGLFIAAAVFMWAIGNTLFVLFIIKIVNDLAKRWLLIQRVRLERSRRDEQKSLEESGESPPDEAESWVDTVSLSEAHSSLLGLLRLTAIVAAIWVIWAPTLPGLNVLDGITAWHVVDSGDPNGALRAITIADLLIATFILLVTILIAKNLPPVLQAFMFEWFKTSPGARYAFGILFQYFVVAIGGTMVLTLLGWEWSKVQWLVAALGLGIGFGLQEIVANFISGIIILFERPVRVGDIISVGGAEGKVLRINPRATVIETFERKEVLIPNKELITSQVVNWTLTGSATRLLVPVGIAYGSDVRLAQSLILEASREVPLVMTDPAPVVSFDDFGDNSLLLMLRCYVEEERVQVWTDLRNLINDKLGRAGIEISYPQRDVHLDTLKPLQIELRRPASAIDSESQ